MRVIAGHYKGRKLVSFKAEAIRPTTDRVKESLFNMIGSSLSEASVLDLYSGTGSLGIEAISRGARHVTFVDSSEKSHSILRKNLELLNVPSDFYSICKMDSLKFLKRVTSSFDVILIDPPFTKVLGETTMDMVGSCPSLFNEHTVLTIEIGQKERLKSSYGRFNSSKVKDFGDKSLHIFSIT